jgi:hypothetical protein
LGDFGRLTFSGEGNVISYQNEYYMIAAGGIEIKGNTVTGLNWTLELNDDFIIQNDGDDFKVIRR